MKVYLITPCQPDYIWRKRRTAFVFPPLALPIIAALTPKSIEVKLTDEALEDVDLDYPADLVGLSLVTATAYRGYNLARHFRAKGAKVVMGGVHPSVLPQEALQHCDSVVIGEAEGCWQEILEDAMHGTLKQVYSSKDNFPISMIPMPRWDLLPAKKYFLSRTVQASRGCPYNCSFCSVSQFFGTHYRFRPVSHLIEEIRQIPDQLILFADDNIAGNHAYAKELFKAMIPIGKIWISQCSISIAKDDELLSLAAKSGCAGLLIGFETLSKENLAYVGKKVNQVEEYKELIKKIQRYRIAIQGSFIFGFDEDESDVFDKTTDFVIRNRLEAANYCPLTPFPGTRLYDDLLHEGRLLHQDWSKYDRKQVVFKPRKISPEILKKGTWRAYRKTYSFPSILRRWPPRSTNWKFYLALNIGFLIGIYKNRKY